MDRQLVRIEEFISKFKEDISNEFMSEVAVGVGRVYTDFNSISQSFIDALYALKFKTKKGNDSIIYIDETANTEDIPFEYTLEKENQIINLIKLGNQKEVNELISGLIELNSSKKEITPEMLENLLNALVSTAIRAIYEMDISIKEVYGVEYSIYKNLGMNDSFNRKVSIVKEFFSKITEFIGEQKTSQADTIYQSMIKFIEQNYQGDISLNILEEEIGFSAPYLSHIFKKVAGELFVDYVNKFRINKAKELIVSTNQSLYEIAELVGFTNANNFNRVYKKYEGITPGQYRSQQRE